MKKYATTRKSHCTVCGRRLSVKTKAGKIVWRPSHIDDKGITCAGCATPPHKGARRIHP